jgi:radical SAM protein with 4Fe4S-binding SPASM domain
MSNFYCAAPWRGLHINPQGSVKTCCAGNPNMLGNLNTQTIEEILNSNKLKEIRRSISHGTTHEYCSNCVNAERFGADSERAWHNNVNPNFNYATAGEEYHHPTIVDVRWNTTCNLSCNYCGPSCSSKWAALKNVPFKSVARPYYEQVCDFIAQHQEHIHEVALVGGEPLLLPENDRLLDVIPKDAIVTLITNLSIDLENNKIFKKLQQRRKVGWSMSFDNIGLRFEYVRHGATWELQQKNLKIIKNLMTNNGHWGGIHAVYNIYNATRICELKQFAKDFDFTILWQNLFQPEQFDPFLHGVEVAKLAAEEINRFYATDMVTNGDRVFFNQALRNYKEITNSNVNMAQTFAQYTTEIEAKYHQDQQGKFVELWPEFIPLLRAGGTTC